MRAVRRGPQCRALRVLFSCRPLYGHYTPLVGLARTLQNAGHDVRFATAAPLDGAIRDEGYDVDTVGLSEPEIWEIRLRDLDWSTQIRNPLRQRLVSFGQSFAAFEVPPRVAGMREVVQRWRPDLLIHETSEFAAPLVGALEGLPVVNHSFGPLVEADVMVAAGEAAASHWKTHGLPIPDRGGMYGLLYLDITPPSLQFPHIATVPRVQSLRPVPIRSSEVRPAPWLLELGSRPVVTVTFGTVFNDQLELYRSVIGGLADSEFDVVVALGRAPVAASLGPLPHNVQVHEWVSWADLLARSTLVITHGGASSTLGPLSFGLPIVMIPLAADHFTNARMAGPSGAAVVLDAGALTPRGVREAVDTAMGESVRRAARRVAHEISMMPPAEEVVPVLAALIR